MIPRLVAVIALVLASAAGAASPGWLGFSMSAEVNFLMKLDGATVNKVFKDSPAERAGIAAGDQILEVEGCAIPGCGAPKAKSLMERPAGSTVHLKLRRQSGEEYAVALVAEAGPTARR